MVADKQKGLAVKIIINLFLIVVSISCIFPVIWMIYSSFKTQPEFSKNIVSLPTKLQFDNYLKAIIRGKMGIYFMNSLFNAFLSVFLIIILSFITGYFIARFNFKGKGIVYAYFLSGMLVPIYALLIPIFIEFQWLKMYNNRFTLIFPYTAFGLPVAIFLVESFVRGIPTELEEAALLDGCSIWKTMMKIIMPVCRPVLATVSILSFLNSWNEFPLALVLVSDDSYKTIPLGLTNFTSAYTADYPQLMAALVIASLPVVLMYLIFNKRVIEGMTAGAIKG